MNTIKILPISVYEFQAPNAIVDRLELQAKNIKYINNLNNKGSYKQEKIIDHEFDQWATDCLNQVKKEVYGDTTWELFITQIWSNRANLAEFHHKHVHPNSILSGILYLSDVSKGGETKFFSPNPYWTAQQNKLLEFNYSISDYEIVDFIKPKRGKLIIFPSNLWHSVNPITKVTDTRYSIALNSFFKGTLGSEGRSTYLSVN